MKTKILILTASGLLITAAILVHLRMTKAGFTNGNIHASSVTGAKDAHEQENRPDIRLGYRRSERPESVCDSRQVLRERLFSDDPSGQIEAAHDLAAFNDEEAFKTIAECIARMETIGDPADENLIAEISKILSNMRGEELIHVATEFAYSPSRAVAEAATNVAVGSNGNEIFNYFGSDTSESEQQEQAQLVGELLQENK